MLKDIARQGLKRLIGLAGMRLLTQQQTIDWLQPHQMALFPAHRQPMPKITDAVLPSNGVFPRNNVLLHTGYVWQLPDGQQKAKLLPSGNVVADGHVLCTDFSLQDVVADMGRFVQRPPRQAGVLIAPFGHYQDGIVFGGYYDFMLLVAAKLSLIHEALSAVSLAEATVAYPLFGTSYEREFLTHLGFRPDRILDSRQHAVSFDTCVLSNNGDWYHPNAAGVLALRRQLLRLVPNPEAGPQQRIYVSRAGRRRVLNEDALTRMLATYDFLVIEDKPRTLAEQCAIYNRASLILGPHGASFANIIACRPDTHLFELFAPGYVPDFFLYLAQLLGMSYSAHVAGTKTYTGTSVTGQDQAEDLTVSVSGVERSLNQLFERQARPVL